MCSRVLRMSGCMTELRPIIVCSYYCQIKTNLCTPQLNPIDIGQNWFGFVYSPHIYLCRFHYKLIISHQLVSNFANMTNISLKLSLWIYQTNFLYGWLLAKMYSSDLHMNSLNITLGKYRLFQYPFPLCLIPNESHSLYVLMFAL